VVGGCNVLNCDQDISHGVASAATTLNGSFACRLSFC